MIRIFVTEDQPLFLQDITNQIMSLRDDLILSGTAANGEDALNKLRENPVDIVFTDIKMPRLSGLELIEHVKKVHPKTKFVVISGYQDYEYMHKAIQLAADEYLLKPITTADIQQVVDKLCLKILTEKEDNNRKIIEQILLSRSSSKLGPYSDWQFQSNYIWLLNAGPCMTYGMDFLNPFTSFWEKIDLQAHTKAVLEDKVVAFSYSGRMSNEKLLFWGTNQDPEPLEQTLAHSLLGVAESSGIPLTIGISRRIEKIENIGLERQVLQTLLRKNLIFAESSLLLCRDMNLLSKTEFRGLSSVQENGLKRDVNQHNSDSLKRTIVEIINHAKQQHMTQMGLQQLMNSILLICIADDDTINEDYQLLIEESLCNARTYDELIDPVLPIFLFCGDWSPLNVGGVSSALLQKAHQYISKHFNEPITIHEIANLFHIEPSYFSRMFRKEFGITAIEYLTTCRIEQAKNLLNSNRTVRDVAILCGYQDQFYFSRIFKKTTGIAPSEFQRCRSIK